MPVKSYKNNIYQKHRYTINCLSKQYLSKRFLKELIKSVLTICEGKLFQLSYVTYLHNLLQFV